MIHPCLDNLRQALKGTAADKQYIRSVNLYQLLLRMLPPTLGRNARHSAFQNLQECLLHTLAGYIPGNRRILRLPCNLIYLIHIDDTHLGTLNIAVCSLDDFQQDIFHILAYIPGFCQRCGVCNRERHIYDTCQRLRQQRLPASGRAEHQYVALLQLNAHIPRRKYPLVVVVDRNGQNFLGLLLSNHILIQKFLHFFRFQ